MRVRIGCPACSTEVACAVDADSGELLETIHLDRPGSVCDVTERQLTAAALDAALLKMEGLRDAAHDRTYDERITERRP